MSLTDVEKRLVGGSDVAAIVGVSPYGSAYSVWERIVNGVERADTPALSRGRRLEPVVLDWYAEHTGRMLTRDVRLRDAARPHIRVSFDALGERMRGVREVLAGFGWSLLGCAVWLLGMVAWENPQEAKVVAAVVFVVGCWAVIIAGLLCEGRRWR